LVVGVGGLRLRSDLLAGVTGDCPFRTRDVLREYTSHGRRIEAGWPETPPVPELGIIKTRRPRASDKADPAVGALGPNDVALLREDEHFGMSGDR